jgi:tetratricopeptide (TPR) repeat protein
MPANKNSYNDAMKKASNAAWDRKWEAAIREYRRALVELPEDVPAHSGLALTLEQCGRLDEALHEYRLISKMQPHDPVPLAHTAALYQKLGRGEEATGAYLELAEMFVGLKQMNKAVEAWRHAVGLDPDRTETREKLIAAYRDGGHDGAAAQELTALARIYQRRGETTQAQALVEEALQADADNSQAKSLLAELSGRGERRSRGAAEGSPVEQARRSSLSRLAATVFDEGPRWRRNQTSSSPPAQVQVEALLARALDAQTRGQYAEAIESYEQVLKAGLSRTEIQFNLALLYQSALRYDDAVALFKQTATAEQYALASFMALGQCYRAQDKVDVALENFIQATKIVDLSSVQREQADQVIHLYESLAEGYRAQGAEADAETFMQSLMEFLSSKGWEDKVREVRQHIETLGESGTPVSFVEVLETPDAAHVIEAMRLSGEHLKRGRLVAASEEALHAIEIAPNYLPAHVQLAEILTKGRRLPEAREKYEMLAETAVMRGDAPKAVSFYHHALALAPDDVTRRAKLIDLLVRQGQLPEALGEYLELGGALERAGPPQNAIDRYAEALRLAQRAGVVGPVVGQLRHRLADAYLKERDWEKALPLYKEMCAAAPDDERTRFILAELYFHLGQQEAGDRELDELLQRAAHSPKTTLAVLATLARNLPQAVPVQLRVAEAYAQAGQRERAIDLLDNLGEQLLTAGQRQDAVRVIGEIIALQPPRVEDYQKLLNELTAS